MLTDKLTFIDLFAGCGGMSLGLEQADFQPVFVNELNPDALETWMRNRREIAPWIEEYGLSVNDVRKLTKHSKALHDLQAKLDTELGIKAGEIDLLVGGPPCQGFSGIGHRRSYSVAKEDLPANRLFEDMATAIQGLQPKAFVFENVRGLLNGRWTPSGRPGQIWEDVYQTFKSLGTYQIAAQLIYAKDYGVPQNRPRLILVGLRRDISNLPGSESELSNDAVDRGFLPSSIKAEPPHLGELLGDLVDPDYQNGGATEAYPNAATGIQRRFRTPRDGGPVSRKGSAVEEHQYSNHSAKVVEKFEAMLAGDGRVPARFATKKFAQRVLPENWDEGVGPTITATSLPDDYVHFSQPRTLTVREWARLQGFPDWYQFSGKRTTGGLRRAGNPRLGVFDRELPKYTQIGNAVPVQLAYQIGVHLRDILHGKR
ncbi:MAG: DNA cytosine methyltransferase [Gemmatimonadota bacterium]